MSACHLRSITKCCAKASTERNTQRASPPAIKAVSGAAGARLPTPHIAEKKGVWVVVRPSVSDRQWRGVRRSANEQQRSGVLQGVRG